MFSRSASKRHGCINPWFAMLPEQTDGAEAVTG